MLLVKRAFWHPVTRLAERTEDSLFQSGWFVVGLPSGANGALGHNIIWANLKSGEASDDR